MDTFSGLNGGEEFKGKLIPDLNGFPRPRSNEPTARRPSAELVRISAGKGPNYHSWEASDTILAPVVVKLSDHRRNGAQLQGRIMIDVGRGYINGFEEPGHKMEAVSGGIQKLAVLCNIIRPM